MSEKSPEGCAAPEWTQPTVSASETGDARASDVSTVVTGIVVGSPISNTMIKSQKNWYTLFSTGWFILPATVGLIITVVLTRQPPGPIGQFVPLYGLLAVAMLASVLLAVLAGEPGGEERASGPSARVAGSLSLRVELLLVMLFLVAAVSGLVWMEYLRNHGEVEVTHDVDLEKRTGVGNGEWATLVLDGRPGRDHLKTTVSIKNKTTAGHCAPGTELSVALEGDQAVGTNRGLQDGDTAELEVGGGSKIRVRLTVHTIQGCHVNLAVTDVFLHD